MKKGQRALSRAGLGAPYLLRVVFTSYLRTRHWAVPTLPSGNVVLAQRGARGSLSASSVCGRGSACPVEP